MRAENQSPEVLEGRASPGSLADTDVAEKLRSDSTRDGDVEDVDDANLVSWPTMRR